MERFNSEGYSIRRMSPLETEAGVIVPEGSSIAKEALKHMAEILKVGREEITPTTLFPLSTKSTSMGKRMKKVCIELQDFITSASPFGSSFLPNNPLSLVKIVPAILTSVARTVFLVLLISRILIETSKTPWGHFPKYLY